MHTIQFTSDSYNFPNNSCNLHNISIFNITLDFFIIIKVYLTHSVHLFDIMCYWMCYVWIFA